MDRFFKMLNNLTLDNYDLQVMQLGFSVYKSEFETVNLLMNHPLNAAELSSQKTWDSCKVETKNTSTIESTNLREQGNKLFKDSPEQNALEACRFYTKSIFAAPLGSEALALAHANRAMALQKFGYFLQAYDDCECALEQGYPKNLRHKIIARQATCAEKMGDAALLQKHLDALATLSLNKSYETQMEELQQSLEKLKREEKNVENNNQDDIKEYKGSHRICKTELKGRFLVTEKPIKKDELIFTEYAFSFVPASKRHVCQHCAATQFIPFPCYRCNGKVVYCSLKCRVAHQEIHAYECKAYQSGFCNNKDGHLALRMVLDGIEQIISFLEQKRTSKDIWNELTCEKSSLMQSNCKYVQSLQILTHLGKKPLKDILKMANEAYLLSWYLKNHTKFFNIFKKCKASFKDWQTIIASLILRHMGQLRTNRSTLPALTINISDPHDSTLLVTKLWQSPFHVRRGFLHMFHTYENVLHVNLPYFNLCNNACFPSMVTKKNGRYLSAYAINNIEAGAEILNSYTMGYRNIRRLQRQRTLSEKYHFECKCVKCTKENPDEDYEKYHRFRCEKCHQIFVLYAAELDSKIRCGKCRTFQQKLFEELNFIEELLIGIPSEGGILLPLLNERIKAYKRLDQRLVGPHDIKITIAVKFVAKCFEMYNACPSQFNNYNFSQIIELLKFHLQYKIERFHLKTIDYVGPMTYLWDFIALGKYQCGAKEMNEMLQAIEILPDETRKLFINYYNDYIVGNIK